MKVCGLITTVWNSGGSLYRLDLPFTKVPFDGWQCPRLNDYEQGDDGRLIGRVLLPPHGHQTRLVDGIDVLVTQRWMNADAVRVTREAQAVGQVILSDVDDHYWELQDDNIAKEATDPSSNPTYNRASYWNQIAASDGIIVSTPELERYFNDRLEVPTYLRRNMIDLDMWTWQDTTKRGWEPRVGWTGVTKWRTTDLSIPEGAIGEFVEENDLEFAYVGYNVGCPEAWDLFGVPPRALAFKGWQVDITRYPTWLNRANFDIGVIPLHDNPFNRAKSCLKGMEFAACGIPFVASPLPEYEWLGIGILAKTPRDWRNALKVLLDPDARADIAEEGRFRVEQLTYQEHALEYLDLLEAVSG